MASRTLIVGLGSHHGDDGVGWRVVEQLAACVSGGTEVRAAAAPGDMLAWLDGVEALHVCDACRATGRAGEVCRWQWPDLNGYVTAALLSSHGLSLPDVLSLADRLRLLPPRVIIWGVEIADARPGNPLCATVENAVRLLARQVAGEISDA